MSVEKLNDELEFAASQGPDTAVMTTQETVRAVLAEVGVIYVLADGSHVTGERAVDLYDDELARCKRVSSELADCRADLARMAISHESERMAKIERGDMLCACQDELAKVKSDLRAIEEGAADRNEVIDNLALLLRRTSNRLPPFDPLRVQVIDYLKRHSLAGVILRPMDTDKPLPASDLADMKEAGVLASPNGRDDRRSP